jgi:hypothetical protein
MTKRLDRAVEAARSLPVEAQDEIAHILLQLTGSAEDAAVLLTPEEEAAVAVSMAAAACDDFATDEEVRAVWAKHGL